DAAPPDAAVVVCPPPPAVVINEVLASNQTGLLDEDGDTPDWIELHNAGPDPVDLAGYGLSDDPDEPFAWVMPPRVLAPDEYLVVLASGKDRRATVATWDTRIDWGALWRYLPVEAQQDPFWPQPGFDDSGWPEGPSGFGRADNDDATVVATHTIYVRHTFEVTAEEIADLQALLLHVDYDDGFVAYLNGVEVARALLGAPGVAPAPQQFADAAHEAVLVAGSQPEVFDLFPLADLLVPGENVLALELHDASAQSSDTSLIPFLTFGFGSGRPGAPSMHLDLPNRFIHTDFSLSASGETLTLTAPDGCEVDRLVVGRLPADASYGPGADGQLGYFIEPTPGGPNITEARRRFAAPPTLFPPPGHYPEGVEVTVDGGGAEVRVTQDSSEPGLDDPLADGAIPVGPAPGISVIRARAFAPNAWPSAIVTGTYLVAPPSTLPTVSMVTEPSNLWDVDTGIYVLGDSYQQNVPYFGANFWEDWERPLHVEFWEPGGEPGFSLDCGVKIHGGWSRANAQRSLRFIMRPGYGTASLEYPLFEGLDVQQFQRVVLRNSGNDWGGCNNGRCTPRSHLRDAVMHQIASGLGIAVMAYRPVAAYLNGEFWGIYNIRERPDRPYLQAHYGVDAVDLLEANVVVNEGDSDHYEQLLQVLRTEDIASPETYARVQALMDVDDFATYEIVQIFHDNEDWPGNNIKYWRPKTPEGKWRWLLYDTDFGLGWRNPNPAVDSLAFALRANGPNWPNPPWSTEVLRTLVRNPAFATRFINRYADYLNTAFRAERTRDILARTAATVRPEMQAHLIRWASGNEPAQALGAWENQVNGIDTWLRDRPGHAFNHIAANFGLGARYALTLQADPPEGGSFQLTAAAVPPAFTGTYFVGVPVTITAVPAEGFAFDGWDTPELGAEATVVVSPPADATFTARFVPAL
ncbi:MAG: CotH kinase family protein, partial [Myxococcales bacterium]|nr:CotH kinase family protein [Myxococcales bacterium]